MANAPQHGRPVDKSMGRKVNTSRNVSGVASGQAPTKMPTRESLPRLGIPRGEMPNLKKKAKFKYQVE